MKDDQVVNGVNAVDDIMVIQLKDKLRRRRLKTISYKAELVKRLQTEIFLESQKDDEVRERRTRRKSRI